MTYKIDKINISEYPQVVDLWEASVKATHHFLKNDDIEFFKPLLLNEYLNAVKLRCIRNSYDEIIGFLGVSEQNLEMLFIHPKFLGKGIGKALLNFAIDKMDVFKVDVNEQNEQAVGFYYHSGFITKSRSELDASGKPYPTLHMELEH